MISEIDKLKHFHIKVMRKRFYGFNNRFRTTKNTEAIVFEMVDLLVILV